MHSRTQTQYRAYTHTFVEQVYLCAHVSEQAWAGLTLWCRRATSLLLRMRVAVRQGEPRDEPLFVYNASAKTDFLILKTFNMVLKMLAKHSSRVTRTWVTISTLTLILIRFSRQVSGLLGFFPRPKMAAVKMASIQISFWKNTLSKSRCWKSTVSSLVYREL